MGPLAQEDSSPCTTVTPHQLPVSSLTVEPSSVSTTPSCHSTHTPRSSVFLPLCPSSSSHRSPRPHPVSSPTHSTLSVVAFRWNLTSQWRSACTRATLTAPPRSSRLRASEVCTRAHLPTSSVVSAHPLCSTERSSSHSSVARRRPSKHWSCLIKSRNQSSVLWITSLSWSCVSAQCSWRLSVKI